MRGEGRNNEPFRGEVPCIHKGHPRGLGLTRHVVLEFGAHIEIGPARKDIRPKIGPGSTAYGYLSNRGLRIAHDAETRLSKGLGKPLHHLGKGPDLRQAAHPPEASGQPARKGTERFDPFKTHDPGKEIAHTSGDGIQIGVTGEKRDAGTQETGGDTGDGQGEIQG